MPSYTSSDKPSRSNGKSSSGKFNTWASAIGFKSKKHPSLAIQDPPQMPTRTVVSTVTHIDPTRQYINRPPSKSISSVRSQADSSEPRTPVDNQKDFRHQSLLTLSDADPFAANGIAVPRSTVDPNRLSAYSNSSVVEYSKRSDGVVNRGSYASTSSQSQGHGDGRSISSLSRHPSSEVGKRRLLSKKSTGDLGFIDTSDARDAAWKSLSKQNSKSSKMGSPTFLDMNRHSQPDPSQTARPPMRARGFTESGSKQPLNLFSDVKPIDQASPRVIVRQASFQRMGLPPSAPPTQRLPTPPSVDLDDAVFSNTVSQSQLDDMSYTSSILSRDDYMPNQHYIPREGRQYRDVPSDVGGHDLYSPPRPRTLKKSISHQSLTKKNSTNSNFNHASGSCSPLSVADSFDEKGPRKQRSFHHPRIALPPIPLPLRQTHSSGSTHSPPDTMEKCGSTTRERKRLFSGSNFGRPTTASTTNYHGDEDTRSIFSLPAEPSQRECEASGSLSKAMSSSSSFWDEGSPVLSSPQEYVPQHIMSPAEMLQVEASVQESITRQSRQRGMSIVSSETNGSEFSVGEGLAAPFSSHTTLSPSSPYTTSQTTLTSITSGTFFSPQPSTSSSDLAKPPKPRPSRVANAETGIIPLSPPPRLKMRKKFSGEPSTVPRSPAKKKPSFLDIDDMEETKRQNFSSPPKVESPVEGSFLDLRESFESERSLDDGR